MQAQHMPETSAKLEETTAPVPVEIKVEICPLYSSRNQCQRCCCCFLLSLWKITHFRRAKPSRHVL